MLRLRLRRRRRRLRTLTIETAFALERRWRRWLLRIAGATRRCRRSGGGPRQRCMRTPIGDRTAGHIVGRSIVVHADGGQSGGLGNDAMVGAMMRMSGGGGL